MSLAKCKKCGTVFRENDKSCPECGTKLDRKPMGCGTALGIIFVAITLVILDSFVRSTNSPDNFVKPELDIQENINEKGIAQKWMPQIEEICKDWAFYKAKVYKYSMEGEEKKAREASNIFKSITNELSQYPEEDVYEACKKYDTPEYLKKYM
ncbi:MAG: hypothetical protein H6936_18160 [Burkholderiales bacterium]|nr:hypothetical protein [Calditrichota bacterium]MCP5276720.1 hypothetical protein [Burkholderiales bacterium]